jgi:hypothetical protein
MDLPGWKIYLEDLELLVQAGKENAAELFDTNDKWQGWRGYKRGMTYSLGYEAMTVDLLEKIQDNDPSLLFEDEEPDTGNSLED